MLADARIIKLAMRAAAGFLFVVALLLHAEQLYVMAVMLLVIPFISYLIGGFSTRGIECKRKMSLTCTVHENVRVSLTVRNNSLFPKFNLRVDDRTPRWIRYCGADSSQGLIFQVIGQGETQTLKYDRAPAPRHSPSWPYSSVWNRSSRSFN
jgi:hypothetical protein